ncbi:hypothetical protein M5K25_023000 [Dendrobium thyrsiflorum]|uniref:Uncharacterized protein n=1 Tax=Dendrobium thyrsiflorum TaxID=117978 RepID=A0ABD0U774_DENTH
MEAISRKEEDALVIKKKRRVCECRIRLAIIAGRQVRRWISCGSPRPGRLGWMIERCFTREQGLQVSSFSQDRGASWSKCLQISKQIWCVGALDKKLARLRTSGRRVGRGLEIRQVARVKSRGRARMGARGRLASQSVLDAGAQAYHTGTNKHLKTGGESDNKGDSSAQLAKNNKNNSQTSSLGNR